MSSSKVSRNKTGCPNSKSALPAAIAIFCAVLCFIPLVQAVAPRALAFLPTALGVVFLISLRLISGRWPSFSRFYIMLIFGVAGLAALSSLWALDSGVALERSLKIGGVFLGGGALFTVLRADIPFPPFLYWALPLAALGAGIFCVSELITGGFLHYAWRGIDTGKHNLSVINRSVVSFILLLLPALVFLGQSSCSAVQKRLVQGAFLLVSVAIILMTHSQSAHLALLTLGVFWFSYPLFRFKVVQIGLIAIMCAAILAGPWLAQYLYAVLAGDLHTMPWFSDAYAADRLEIWDFVSRKILENPLYGFGIEATRHIEHFDTPMRFTPLDHVLHPHNAVLQVWIEFGVIGALGLCAITAFILRNIFALENGNAQRLCLAVFTAGFVMACISYGLWQGWWLGLFTFIAALCGHLAQSKKAAI